MLLFFIALPHALFINPSGRGRLKYGKMSIESNKVFSTPTAPQPPSISQWYFLINGQSQGPFPEAKMREFVAIGVINADSFVWNDEPENAGKGWQRAANTELAALMLVNGQV
jgi:hypothetical protein